MVRVGVLLILVDEAQRVCTMVSLLPLRACGLIGPCCFHGNSRSKGPQCHRAIALQALLSHNSQRPISQSKSHSKLTLQPKSHGQVPHQWTGKYFHSVEVTERNISDRSFLLILVSTFHNSCIRDFWYSHKINLTKLIMKEFTGKI